MQKASSLVSCCTHGAEHLCVFVSKAINVDGRRGIPSIDLSGTDLTKMSMTSSRYVFVLFLDDPRTCDCSAWPCVRARFVWLGDVRRPPRIAASVFTRNLSPTANHHRKRKPHAAHTSSIDPDPHYCCRRRLVAVLVAANHSFFLITMGKEKIHISLVVIGHVDAGTSPSCSSLSRRLS
jgi:hypothetical protein